MLNNLRGTTIIDPLRIEHEAADPDDAWLLALAEQGQADFLITGDKRSGLLALARIGTARISTARVFCDLLAR